jgi:hypothetical protein
MKLIAALQRESPLTLAREALWRTQRRWRQMNFQGQMRATACPVRYRPAGYYQVRPSECDDRSTRAILSYANAICHGRFPWFAYGAVQLGFPPRWDFDFVSGKAWPEANSDTVQIVRHDGSDVKVPWELSRLQFLPVLAKAGLISGETCYRQAGRELLDDWIEKNPVGVGVNWTMPMEAALRAISICLFLELLGGDEDQAGDPWLAKVAQSLWQHFRFIEAYNEFSHFARSNHYLSNILGLFCLSSYLQGSGTERKRRFYKRLLEQEILLQVYEDGGDYEASAGYHLLNLQMFSCALRLMDAQKMEPDPEFVGRLRNMYWFLAGLADQRGQVPHIGDCDDGRIELLVDDLEQTLATEGRHSLTVSSLLGVGESLLGEHYGGRRQDTAWYAPVPSPRESKPSEGVGRPPAIFPVSGVAVATAGLAQVVFLAMPNGIHGKGSHTHNDKLSIIVRLAGEELFRDSGTGWYTRESELRNRFRSTAAHNTIRVDGEEQNRFSPSPGDLFRISDDAQVTPIEVQETKDERVLRASHHGYDRLGVVHTRSVRLGPESSLTLQDHLTTAGSHTFEAYFQLQREWQVEVHQRTGTEVRCHLQGPRVTADLCCQAPVELEMLCLEGEVSNSYGATEAAKRIVVRGSFRGPLRLLSCVSWPASRRDE